MSGPHLLLFLLLALAAIITGIRGECTQNRDGCRIANDRCECGHGCYSEYRYTTKSECQKALRGKRQDICQRNPCQHGGVCSQTTLDPGYKCRCQGTGFYGDRCSVACPKYAPGRAAIEYPYVCIEI